MTVTAARPYAFGIDDHPPLTIAAVLLERGHRLLPVDPAGLRAGFDATIDAELPSAT